MQKFLALLLGCFLLVSCGTTSNKNPHETNPTIENQFSNEIGEHKGSLNSFNYLYYVPSCYNSETGLLLFLHGCGNDGYAYYKNYDFKKCAEEYNAVVVLPSQNYTCNTDLCWNWFFENNRKGFALDSAAINEITRQVIEACNINKDKVYISGLSAGAAEAIGLFFSNPMYKGIASVAGIADGVANTINEANDVISGNSDFTYPKNFYKSVALDKQKALIFHGKMDERVVPANAKYVVKQMTTLFDYIDDKQLNDSLTKEEFFGSNSLYQQNATYNVTSYNDGTIVYYDIDNYPHTITNAVLKIIFKSFFGEKNDWKKDLTAPRTNDELTTNKGINEVYYERMDFAYFLPDTINENTSIVLSYFDWGKENIINWYKSTYKDSNVINIFPLTNAWQDEEKLNKSIDTFLDKFVDKFQLQNNKIVLVAQAFNSNFGINSLLKDQKIEELIIIDGYAYGNDTRTEIHLTNNIDYDKFANNVGKIVLINGTQETEWFNPENRATLIKQLYDAFDYKDDGNLNSSLEKQESSGQLIKNYDESAYKLTNYSPNYKVYEFYNSNAGSYSTYYDETFFKELLN